MRHGRGLGMMSRRGILSGLATALAWFLAACGGGRRGATRAAFSRAGAASPTHPPTASSLAVVQATPVANPAQSSAPTVSSSPTSTTLPSRTAAPSPTPTVTGTPRPTSTPVPGGPADLVLLNGKVITVDPKDTIAQALAVRGDRIVAVGRTEELLGYVGPATQTIDLKGRAVTPGLNDSHNHMQVTGLTTSSYTAFLPPEVKSVPELQAKLRQSLTGRPEGQWFQGYFLTLGEGYLPTRQDLDPFSPKHPVWLLQQGGHYGSANSLGLKLAGITRDTPSPVGGVIDKDSKGEPTGVFYNHRAMDVLRRVIPPISAETARANIISPLPQFLACGVTSFQDNNIRGVDTVRLYYDVSSKGQMPLRASVWFTLEWPQDVDRGLQLMPAYRDAMTRFEGAKFLLDGQASMAYCHQPHNGVRHDVSTWEPNSFKRAVRTLHDAGMQICVHVIGDAAADLTLDAYAEAQKANPRPDPRHRLEHVILTTPQATQRMKDLGVVVSTQPQFLRMGGDGYAKLFGEERNRRILVTREWLENGVPLALGSDAPTTPWYNPQMTLWGAVTRTTLSNQVHEPAQRLTIQEALRAHTMGSAYAEHQEKVKGSLEPGKLADLIVWHEDPYGVPPQRLPQLTIDLTILGGKIVFSV